jgi:hypothetical protein
VYSVSVSTRTIWILRSALEGLAYVLMVGAVGPLGTQHPSLFLIGAGVKVFLSSLLQQAGNESTPTIPEVKSKAAVQG